ncbi:MAG: A/G-specific adenine glycosylase [Deltaproteobacteria bacterium]|nr:A/G-specific adenine glycosylase [Deltaproteobacteria bacterium]
MTRPLGPTLAQARSRSTAIRRALLAWFRKNARVLPWRTDPRDPWAVWVSEVMLQQTRVTTVVPYFHAFMLRYPDVKALASAELDEVLGAWSGLGYYRRARALHAGARDVVDRFEATIPSTIDELLSLPGVGDYTSAAIGSIAFGLRAAVVDGNVRRVIARLFALRSQQEASSVDLHKQIAQTLLPARAPGTFNEAMMELGALVCTPGQPRCEACPVRASCDARRLGLQDSIPAPLKRDASPVVRLIAAVVSRGDAVLMGKRDRDGLFGGMWDPPVFEQPIDPTWRRWLTKLRASPGRLPAAIASVRHVLTHRVLEVDVLCIEARGDANPQEGAVPPGYQALRWMTAGDMRRCGTSSLARRVLQAAGLK